MRSLEKLSLNSLSSVLMRLGFIIRSLEVIRDGDIELLAAADMLASGVPGVVDLRVEETCDEFVDEDEDNVEFRVLCWGKNSKKLLKRLDVNFHNFMCVSFRNSVKIF